MRLNSVIMSCAKKIGQYRTEAQKTRSAIIVARAQGVFNILGGAWPLLHIRSFEKIFGPKEAHWLVYTVGALFVTNGWTLVTAPGTPDGCRQARRFGTGTALALLTIDLIYVSAGRIPKTFLLDAAAEAFWLLAWSRSTQSH